jgi:dienelactone hydrolase
MLTASCASGACGRTGFGGVLVLLLAGLACCAGPGVGPASAAEKVIHFQHGGHKIEVWQFEPNAPVKAPLPGILVLHGIEGLEGFNNGAGAKYKTLCRIVAGYGYVVHFIHYMNATPQDCLPESSRRKVLRLQEQFKADLTAAPGQENPQVTKKFQEWMACAHAGLDHLRAQKGKADPHAVGVVGLSLGGFVAMSLAVTEPATFGPLALAVVFGGLPPRLLDTKVNKLPPVMLLCGKRDAIVPFQHVLDVQRFLKERKAEVRLEEFDCGHLFDDPPNGRSQLQLVLEAVRITRAFFDQHVKPAVGKSAGQPQPSSDKLLVRDTNVELKGDKGEVATVAIQIVRQGDNIQGKDVEVRFIVPADKGVKLETEKLTIPKGSDRAAARIAITDPAKFTAEVVILIDAQAGDVKAVGRLLVQKKKE